jgi:uncharacterized membrane protein required for colicin V production
MEISDLQTFDYVIMVILGLSVYLGWKNGLIQTFIVFFAWVGSAIIMADNYNWVFEFLNRYIASKFICGFIASAGVYIALVISFSILGEKISKKTAKFGGGVTDKVTGLLFGALCGILVACTFFWSCYMTLFTLNDQKFPEWFAKAKSYKVLKIGSDTIVSLALSDEERAKLMNTIKRKSNKLEDEVKSNLRKKIATETSIYNYSNEDKSFSESSK